MSDISATPLPRAPLLGAAALVVLILCATGMTRMTGIGRSRIVDAPAVEQRSFFALDQNDGSIALRDATSGALIETVAPGTNGFLRGTLRGLARERHRQSLDQSLPFDVVARADGRLTLTDPATHRYVDLGSFGPTNEAVFAQLLPSISSQHAPEPARTTIARAGAIGESHE